MLQAFSSLFLLQKLNPLQFQYRALANCTLFIETITFQYLNLQSRLNSTRCVLRLKLNHLAIIWKCLLTLWNAINREFSSSTK